ncbi:MAG: T9SS type A sorting domain-containing protein [Saprospiraceae bacterium]|nr:T9SS type A sorting domain-containing protein [Saprospiraceae bacterium]
MRIHGIDFAQRALFSALFMIIAYTSYAQGWMFSFAQSAGGQYEPDGNYITGLHEIPASHYIWSINNTPDGYANYMFGCFSLPTGGHYGGNNNFGWESPPFHHFSRKSIMLPDESLMILEEKIPQDSSYKGIYLSRFYANNLAFPENNYVLDWHKQVFANDLVYCSARSFIPATDGGYIILSTVETLANPGNRDVQLSKTDVLGNALWTQQYVVAGDEEGVQVVATPDGGYIILKNQHSAANPAQSDMRLLKVDASGNEESDVSMGANPNDFAADMTRSQDGSLLIIGTQVDAAGNHAFLLKCSDTGTLLWRQDYLMPGRSAEGRQVIEDPNGEIVLTANHRTQNVPGQKILLMKTDASGAALWERLLGQKTLVNSSNVLQRLSDGGYVIGGSNNPSNWPVALVIRTDVNGIIKAGVIKGNVTHDLDENCALSQPDTPLANWIVEATLDTIKLYGTTDSLGEYRIACDTGDYVVRVIPPVDYWNACVQNVPIHVGYLDTITVDFPVQHTVECPFMTVEHGSTLVRRCSTSIINVHYCNFGPVTAVDPYFVIALAPVYTFVSADAPPSQQNGNILTFPLNDMESGECGDFNITVLVDCSAELGEVACSSVHIYPDSLCSAPDPAWSGAHIRVGSTCDGDSVRFQISNQTMQAMPQALEYIIIEDAVLLMQDNFQLGPLETRDIALPANGSTYHLIAQQEPNAPGNDLPLAAVEGCSTGSSFSTGFYNQYPQNDGDPFVSEYCPVVRNSYDPNDKQAVPTGFDEAHYIYPNTDLEYTIRFQNTGNDTAFRVVLIDTLSRYLDPSSIQIGASSHPVNFRLEGNRVLKFTFQPIALPDSTTNLDGSQGYVTFRIRQNPGLPTGTVIENNADIYFDFNAPVRTNTVFHTIHEPPFEVVSAVNVLDNVWVKVETYPNPFSEQLRIQVSGAEVKEASFQLYSTTGQLVRTLPLLDNQAVLQREGLDTGLYFYTVQAGGKMVGTGKIIVKL